MVKISMVYEEIITEKKTLCSNSKCKGGPNRTRAYVYIGSNERKKRKLCSFCRMAASRKRGINYRKKRDERKPMKEIRDIDYS